MLDDPGLALSMEDVSKRYPGTLAVDRVSFDVRAGEVHALLGENGAGKSTLMKILAGEFADYTGRIRISRKLTALHSPSAAKAVGIAMIHQELSLAMPLSIAENLLAGRLPTKFGWLDRGAMGREASALLRQVGLEGLSPWTPVEQLSQHEAQLVEIARALGSRPCILVMDEPTSALSRNEVQRLFDIIRRLRRNGLAIVYISHHLPEVFDIADRVTVLRDGRHVETRDIAEATPRELVESMVGRRLADEFSREHPPVVGEVRLAVSNLTRWGFFHDISFEIRRGEVLALGGLAGSGRSEIARSLVALDPVDAGRVTLDGEEISPRQMADALRVGVAYLTEDRKQEGLALELSALANTVAATSAKRRRRLAQADRRRLFSRFADGLGLNPPEPSRPARQFSGGNQQKLLLAKWLAIEPKVCILDEPTRGVDVAAKATIHDAVRELAASGAAVLLISSDLPEVVALADRVAILRGGRLLGELTGDDITEDGILLAANGGAGDGTGEGRPCLSDPAQRGRCRPAGGASFSTPPSGSSSPSC